jgi:hypothetical protein
MKYFNSLLNLNKYTATLAIQNPFRIDLLTENMASQILTVNEARKARSLPPIEGGDVLIAKQAQTTAPINVNAKPE